MDGIHIIFFHNLFYRIADILLYLLIRRVIIHCPVVGQNPVRMLSCHVVRRKCGYIRSGCRNAVRIHPCVKFHAALVCFRNHERHRVIAGICPLRSCQHSAPWIQIGLIQRIPLRAHLHHNRIQSQRLRLLQLLNKFILLRFCIIRCRRIVRTVYR
ncbi:unknown [Firmicutes bacterium CAG:102]|nr:unknown [Firmicutes bacterium CAG:102]